MSIDKIFEKCKHLRRDKDYDAIDRLLDDLSATGLVLLAKKSLKCPFDFKYALISVLTRLLDDTQEFAEVLNEFFEKTCIDMGRGVLYEPLKERIRENQLTALGLVERMMHMGDDHGLSSGILLSWLTGETSTAKECMRNGLFSEDPAVQRCSLIALRASIADPEIQNKQEYLDLLKKTVPCILPDNSFDLITSLQYAFEESPQEFEPILEAEIKKGGPNAARIYIYAVHHREPVSSSVLQKAVEILEVEDPNSREIDYSLGRIYEEHPCFVVERVRSWLTFHGKLVFLSEDFFSRVKQSTHGINPILTMIEHQVDIGNRPLLQIGDSILERLFSSLGDWTSWCEQWNNDPKKEEIVLKSLHTILKKFMNYEPSVVRNRAIDVVKTIATRENIDFDAETKSINLGKDSYAGRKNKEETLKALHVLDKILSPIPQIDVQILSENLKNAPYLSKAIGPNYLIQTAHSSNPHPLVYIFHHRLPGEGELEQLRKKFEVEEDENERYKIVREHNDLLQTLQQQSYWEHAFKVLDQHDIHLKKSKLLEPDNAWSILTEVEVLSRLAPYFDVKPEPDIPELMPRKLDAVIEYDGETALIEIATVQERLEIALAHGGMYTPGGKVKSVLRDKFNTQLKAGKHDPHIPILIILHVERFMSMYEVMNGIYGALQFSYKRRTDTHEMVEQGSTRAPNGFYEIEGTDFVTAIGAYHREYGRADPLVGKLYHPPVIPRNKLSRTFRVRIRTALFGTSETSDWRSLTKIVRLEDQTANILYQNGIEDIGVLAGIDENEFVLEDISREKLAHYKHEARRIIQALSTDSIKYLKGMTQEVYAILTSKGIYLIQQVLAHETSPDGITESVWKTLTEDARRIQSE